MARLRARARQGTARLARAALRRLDDRDPYWWYEIRLDHPPTALKAPRYGYGRPRHRRLEAALAAHVPTFRDELLALATYHDELLRIPARPTAESTLCWENPFLPGLDTVSLYGYVSRWRPRRYVEVGSGFSTAVAHRAKLDGAAATKIVSIDPSPRAGVDDLCDELVRAPLELADLRLFHDLRAGDMIFLDASHRVFMNSDMVAFYLDVLPELADGVLVGIHDILWPDDYLPEWADYWFSDQYLLGAYLLAGTPWLHPLLASNYACQHPALAAILAPLFDDPRLSGVDRRGFGFWFTIDRSGAG